MDINDMKQGFVVADYIVFSMTVLISVVIGIYFGFKGERTTLKYFHGDRKLKYGSVALSLVVTFQSSIMVLGFPTEVYFYGYMICLFNIGQCAAIYLSTRFVVPMFYPLKITSVNEYLGLRYPTNAVRLLSVSTSIISQSIYMGVVIFGPAIALQSVTNFPVWAAILCITTASVIYTSIGGILAVIWTDVLQCFIIIAGIISILIKGTVDTGGISKVWEENYKSGRLDIFNFDPNPTTRHTFWTIIIGSFVGSFSLTLSQSSIQRCNSTPSEKASKRVLYIAGPVFVAMQIMSMSVGLVCFAYFVSKGCDPLMSRQIKNPNQIVPFMIVDIFNKFPGLSGLFISALFSASLSTVSSILSGLSAITVEDLIKPYFEFSDQRLTLFAKLSVVGYGILGITVAFLISMVPGSLTQIMFSMNGAATGPYVGIFFLSMFFSRSTWKGTFVGGIVGLAVSFWICIGATVTPNLPKTPPLPLPPVDQCVKANVFRNETFMIQDSLTNLSNTHYNAFNQSMSYTIVPTFDAVTVSMQQNMTSSVPVHKTRSINTQPAPLSGIDKVYTLSYAYFSTIGTFVTITVGLLVSLLTYDKNRDTPNPKYVMSLTERFCCCVRNPKNMCFKRSKSVSSYEDAEADTCLKEKTAV